MFIETKSPSLCSDAQLALFQDFILQGSEVPSPQLAAKIKQAHRLIFIHQHNTPIACGALRYATMDYCQDIFNKAGVGELLKHYSYEVSWVYTTPQTRGQNIGHLLMQTAIEQAEGKKCFATTKENNHPSHAIFKRFGFDRLGQAYKSDRGEYYLGLFAQN